MARLERKIAEELIYERLRVVVDLCELMTFEQDLAQSIERALANCARSPKERDRIAMRYLRRAWKRLGEEVSELIVAGIEHAAVDEESARDAAVG